MTPNSIRIKYIQ